MTSTPDKIPESFGTIPKREIKKIVHILNLTVLYWDRREVLGIQMSFISSLFLPEPIY